MKAVLCPRYGPPEILQFTEIPRPVPKDNEVLIKVMATTVSVADIRIRGFDIPASYRLLARLALGMRGPKKPVLGMELAGIVEDIGKGVSRFKPGDEVYAMTLDGFGAYAEYKCLPESYPIAHKPRNLGFEEAAAVPIGATTALHYLRKINFDHAPKVLIYGASGSVGTFAVQLAKHFGAEVTGVCSGRNLEMVRSLGADRVIDYTGDDFTRQLEMYDVIMLAVDKWPFADCNRFLKSGGIYMNVTQPFKNLQQLWTSLTTKKRVVMGQNTPKTPDALIELKELIEAGTIRPVMDRTYPWEQIVEAHRYVDTGRKKGNVAIVVSGEVG